MRPGAGNLIAVDKLLEHLPWVKLQKAPFLGKAYAFAIYLQELYQVLTVKVRGEKIPLCLQQGQKMCYTETHWVTLRETILPKPNSLGFLAPSSEKEPNTYS